MLNLPPTSWAVLGELSFGDELSGYDLKRWADQSLAFFYWAPSQSQIYGELKRLESHELVKSRTEQTHEVRVRKLYSITPAGEKQLELWTTAAEVDPVMLKHPLILRIWAAKDGNIKDILPLVTDYKNKMLERAAQARGHAETAATVPNWSYPSLTLRWAEKFYLAEAERLDWLLEELALDEAPAQNPIEMK